MDGLGDQFGAVIEGVDEDALGQGLVDLSDLGFDVGHHLPRVAPHQHHHHAGHRLAVAVPGDRPLPQHRGEPHLADIGNPDRGAVTAAVEHNRADVVEAADQALPPHQPLFGPAGNRPATGIAVVLLEGLEDLAQ